MYSVEEATKKKKCLRYCPRCGGDAFTYPEDQYMLVLADTKGGLSYSNTPVIPVTIITCKKCGFISMHDTKTLIGESQ